MRHSRGPVIRCLVSGAIATLIYIHANPVFAANPAGIIVQPDPFWSDHAYGASDLSIDWRPYCASGTANTVRWFTADNTLRSIQSNFNCTLGMTTITGSRVPGAIS